MVAWFSAVRVFNTEIAEFSVVETDGSLACTMAAGQGTEKVGDDIQVKKAKAVPAQNAAVLTHGSVNVNSGKAFVVDEEDPKKFVDLRTSATSPDSWLHQAGVSIAETSGSSSKTVDVYIAVSWEMTFTYTFASDERPVAVYLDLKKSTFSEKDDPSPYFLKSASTPHTEDTALGFRIGFYGAGDGVGHDVVWGNNDAIKPAYSSSKTYEVGDVVTYSDAVYTCSTDIATPEEWTVGHWTATPTANNLTYVSAGGDDSDIAHYTNLNYVVHDGGYNRLDNGAEAAATVTKAERICKLTKTDSSATVKCAAWFEGTDPNVISGAAMKCMTASMSFYARALS